MTKLSASLDYMFTDVDYLSRFARAAKAGFKGVEMIVPYEWPKERLAEESKRNGIEVAIMVAPTGDFKAGDRGLANNPDRTHEFQQSIGLAIEYAKSLSCSLVNVLLGLKISGLSDEKVRETLTYNLRFAADSFQSEGILLLIEPINNQDTPNYLISRTRDALRLIEEINHPNCWLLYDVYHQQITEGNLTKTITDNIDRIAYIQVADNPGRHEPGTGEINFGNLLHSIIDTGYDGWIGCEYKPLGLTEDGLGWIDRVIKSDTFKNIATPSTHGRRLGADSGKPPL
jgi:hydroxypyruvate isomerase